MQTSKNVKQGLIVGIVLSLLVSPFSFAKIGYAASDIRLVSSEVITAGAELLNYSLTGVTGQSVKVNVVKVDLDNPYIEVDTMTGDNGKLNGPDRTTVMANEEDAVAAINGDFFNMSKPTSPLGPQVKDGELISSPSFLVGINSFGV
ncbi:MAG: copper amine oxidase, partial [Bacilli bacterium]